MKLFRHKIYPSVIIEEPKQPSDVTGRVGDSWQHTVNDEEGFKSASCTLGGDPDFLRAWFETQLGSHWKMEDMSGHEVWSGMIWTMRLVDEGWEQTQSLDDFANRIRVVYQSDVTGERLHMPSATTWYEVAASQARYGIKDLIQTIGESNAARAADLGGLQQANYGYPGRSKNKTDAGGTTLSINLRGYMSTLGWRVYNYTAAGGTANCDVVIDQIATAVGQFINATDLDTNATPFPIYHNRDRIALTILRDIVAIGDGATPWMIGIYEDRTLRYEQKTRLTYDMLWHKAQPFPVRLDGSVIEPWLIRPGQQIRAPWLVPGRAVPAYPWGDPMTIQIKEANFTAPYTVSLTGTHDERIDILLNRIQNTKW